MAAFMSNGTQTVVREPFHRIGVTENLQSAAWVHTIL